LITEGYSGGKPPGFQISPAPQYHQVLQAIFRDKGHGVFISSTEQYRNPRTEVSEE
jgi:hypothetical protein